MLNQGYNFAYDGKHMIIVSSFLNTRTEIGSQYLLSVYHTSVHFFSYRKNAYLMYTKCQALYKVLYHQSQASLNIVLTDTTPRVVPTSPCKFVFFFFTYTDINSDAVHSGLPLVLASKVLFLLWTSWREVIFCTKCRQNYLFYMLSKRSD